MRLKDILLLRPVKWSLIILAAVFIGIFIGQFITSYETRYLFNREYCGSYKGIDVYKCGEINKENAAAHLRLLEAVPDSLAECCSSIYLTGGSLSVPVIGEEGGKAGQFDAQLADNGKNQQHKEQNVHHAFQEGLDTDVHFLLHQKLGEKLVQPIDKYLTYNENDDGSDESSSQVYSCIDEFVNQNADFFAVICF